MTRTRQAAGLATLLVVLASMGTPVAQADDSCAETIKLVASPPLERQSRGPEGPDAACVLAGDLARDALAAKPPQSIYCWVHPDDPSPGREDDGGVSALVSYSTYCHTKEYPGSVLPNISVTRLGRIEFCPKPSSVVDTDPTCLLLAEWGPYTAQPNPHDPDSWGPGGMEGVAELIQELCGFSCPYNLAIVDAEWDTSTAFMSAVCGAFDNTDCLESGDVVFRGNSLIEMEENGAYEFFSGEPHVQSDGFSTLIHSCGTDRNQGKEQLECEVAYYVPLEEDRPATPQPVVPPNPVPKTKCVDVRDPEIIGQCWS